MCRKLLSLHYPNTKTTDKMSTTASPGMGEAMPARHFSVTSTLPNSDRPFTRFADAVRYLVALRHNQPHFQHALLDADGFLVPSYEILKGLAIVRYDAERTLAAVGTYEASTAPAYDTTPDMPAQEIAEQAIKEARVGRADLDAYTCYTTTITTAAGPSTVLRGRVGTTAAVQPAMLAFLRQCKKNGARWDDSRDFSEPTPAGAIEVCLWLMWGTAIHLQRRIFITRPVGEGPAWEPATPAAPAAEQPVPAVDLLGWQRATLIDMAAGPDTPADVRELIKRLPDEQLVKAAGFVPMLPALLRTWLPVLPPTID
jgi:hypothetical protein